MSVRNLRPQSLKPPAATPKGTASTSREHSQGATIRYPSTREPQRHSRPDSESPDIIYDGTTQRQPGQSAAEFWSNLEPQGYPKSNTDSRRGSHTDTPRETVSKRGKVFSGYDRARIDAAHANKGAIPRTSRAPSAGGTGRPPHTPRIRTREYRRGQSTPRYGGSASRDRSSHKPEDYNEDYANRIYEASSRRYQDSPLKRDEQGYRAYEESPLTRSAASQAFQDQRRTYDDQYASQQGAHARLTYPDDSERPGPSGVGGYRKVAPRVKFQPMPEKRKYVPTPPGEAGLSHAPKKSKAQLYEEREVKARTLKEQWVRHEAKEKVKKDTLKTYEENTQAREEKRTELTALIQNSESIGALEPRSLAPFLTGENFTLKYHTLPTLYAGILKPIARAFWDRLVEGTSHLNFKDPFPESVVHPAGIAAWTRATLEADLAVFEVIAVDWSHKAGQEAYTDLLRTAANIIRQKVVDMIAAPKQGAHDISRDVIYILGVDQLRHSHNKQMGKTRGMTPDARQGRAHNFEVLMNRMDTYDPEGHRQDFKKSWQDAELSRYMIRKLNEDNEEEIPMELYFWQASRVADNETASTILKEIHTTFIFTWVDGIHAEESRQRDAGKDYAYYTLDGIQRPPTDIPCLDRSDYYGENMEQMWKDQGGSCTQKIFDYALIMPEHYTPGRLVALRVNCSFSGGVTQFCLTIPRKPDPRPGDEGLFAHWQYRHEPPPSP